MLTTAKAFGHPESLQDRSSNAINYEMEDPIKLFIWEGGVLYIGPLTDNSEHRQSGQATTFDLEFCRNRDTAIIDTLSQ